MIKRFTFWLRLTAVTPTSGCQAPTAIKRGGDAESQVATLYRSGSTAKDLRLHFASFDTEGEANDYNIDNCEITARLLNANVRKQWIEQGLPDVGFWCEPGPYREDGFAPTVFDAEYSTDTQGTASS